MFGNLPVWVSSSAWIIRTAGQVLGEELNLFWCSELIEELEVSLNPVDG